MCDTLCIIGDGLARFAKNSDRPIGEAQVVESQPRRSGGGVVHTQHLEIDDPGAYAVVGSRPIWLWGFEHGVNELGVAIGNERLFTTDEPEHRPLLNGMDLVRLALERAASADEAVHVITTLLDVHGQGGSCAQDHDDPYYSSFLVVDPSGGWILETTGRSWVASPVTSGTAISNRIVTTSTFLRSSPDVVTGSDFTERNDPLAPLISDPRLAVTRAAIDRGPTGLDAGSLASVLRDHGRSPWGDPYAVAPAVPPPREVGDDFSGVTVCQHVPGVAVTAAAMIAELVPPGSARPLRLWTAIGSPCVSIFVPSFFPHVADFLSDPKAWARIDACRADTEHDPTTIQQRREQIDRVESELWEEADALAEGADPDALARFTAEAGTRAAVALDLL